MNDFSTFRNGIGGELVHQAFGLDITEVETWREFRRALLDHRRTLGGNDEFCDRAEYMYGIFSAGECTVLLAILYAADYRWLADQLTAGGRSFLDLLQSTHGEFRAAVIACLAPAY